MTSVHSERLFFAAWPGEAARRRLDHLAGDLARAHAGKATPPGRIHLTIAFLGEVDSGRIADLVSIAQGLRAEAFTLSLDRTGCFRAARVAWVAASAPPPELFALHAGLAQALRGAGFALEDRPFAPHVTLARGIARAASPLQVTPIEWEVAELALVRSERGSGRYTTIASRRLG